MRVPGVLSVIILTCIASPGYSAEPDEFANLAAQISPTQLMQTVRELSNFDGRQSGTAGGQATAAYIARHLPEAALQPFPITTVQIDTLVRAEIRVDRRVVALEKGQDFLPIINLPPMGQVSAPVVFVGYGIAAPGQGLDEYQGLSAAGKVVLFLRGQPKGFPGRVTHADKVRTAHARGAVAYLTVTGPILSPYEERRGMTTRPVALYEGPAPTALPGLWITPAAADAILHPLGRSVRSFQEEMDRQLAARSGDTGTELLMEIVARRLDATASNILALWPGSDPALREETIILGAHHDHFGIQAGLVFPGADDNASGTAVVLEIARVLATTGSRPKRSLLFLSFAGEEQGLLGSRFYVAHPRYPLSAAKAMINVDHAGVGNGHIVVGLAKLEKSAAQAAAEKVAAGDKLELYGLFPGGDHVPFADAGLPTAAIVTAGSHPDFHQATDTPEKIKPELLALIARYTLALVWALANGEQ
jgi:Peptidase family M28/PA domain